MADTGGDDVGPRLRYQIALPDRPPARWSQHRTPIDGYYQCGSGTHPGGCVMGAPGRLAAQRILRDLGRD